MIQDRRELSNKLLVFSHTLKFLLSQLHEIEKDNESTTIEKLNKTKIIRVEINKVGMEIDKIKKEIIVFNENRVN